MRKTAPPAFFGRALRRVHCLGVTGMGMGPLAVYLAGLGLEVTGEDDAPAPEMAGHLELAGVRLRTLADDCELLVFSSAVPQGHPARAAAAARGIPAVRRGEMLAEAVRGRRLVAVCGAHGKTTTTGMLITALRSAGFPAGYVLGGLFADGSPPARTGSNAWVVAEVDESDGTIGAFAPDITVAVNLDWDHPDFYAAPEELEAAFARLFGRTRSAVLVSDTCARSLRLAHAGVPPPVFHTFGRSGEFAGLVSAEGLDRMTLKLEGGFGIAAAEVRARGEFNAANATAALAAAQLMGAALEARSLAEYPGVRRRQTMLSGEGGVTVLEDYAHHPTEIRALLGSLRRRVPKGGRLVVIFQPHRYSRTAQFAAEFAAALALADRVHLLDVYGAGEAPIPGGTSADIYAELRRSHAGVAASYLPGGDGAGAALADEIRSGDLVAFVGAGDIERYARHWLEERRRKAASAAGWDAAAEKLRAAAPGARIRREEPLARRTTLRVGGAARLYAEPADEPQLQALLRAAGSGGIEVRILGRGSNVIVPDEGVDGLVLSLGHEHWSRFEPLADGSVRVGAGLRLKRLCGLAAAAGLAGFEFLEGIPGSVGGALRMNAGAMGGGMFDVVESVDLMTLGGERRVLRRAELHVDYRYCAELRDAVALAAVLRPAAQAGGTEAIERQIDAYRRRRHETQPREPSAGCMFKNPPGGSAGRLIDESGLKGERVGGAEVSPVHANFIVNVGGATSADVVELIRRVRARVRDRTGIALEPEALLYGKRWEDVL